MTVKCRASGSVTRTLFAIIIALLCVPLLHPALSVYNTVLMGVGKYINYVGVGAGLAGLYLSMGNVRARKIGFPILFGAACAMLTGLIVMLTDHIIMDGSMLAVRVMAEEIGFNDLVSNWLASISVVAPMGFWLFLALTIGMLIAALQAWRTLPRVAERRLQINHKRLCWWTLRWFVIILGFVILLPDLNPVRVLKEINGNASLFTTSINYEALTAKFPVMVWRRNIITPDTFYSLMYASAGILISVMVTAVGACMSLGNSPMKRAALMTMMVGAIGVLVSLTVITDCYEVFQQVVVNMPAATKYLTPTLPEGRITLFTVLAGGVLVMSMLQMLALPWSKERKTPRLRVLINIVALAGVLLGVRQIVQIITVTTGVYWLAKACGIALLCGVGAWLIKTLVFPIFDQPLNGEKKFHMDEKFRLFLMFLPVLVLTFIFSYLPVYGWRYAFFDYKAGMDLGIQDFMGVDYFTQLFGNEAYRDDLFRVLRNTLVMSGLGIATSWLPIAFAILLAELRYTKLQRAVQTLTTIPNFISWVLVYSIALAVFSTEGFINSLGRSIAGDSYVATNYLMGSDGIWIKMLLWGTWKGLGWSAIVYIAGIAGIDQQLYEAARVDGANRWQCIRHITVPGLMPTYMVMLLMSVAGILSNGMEQYLVFENPTNQRVIEVLDLYVYHGIENSFEMSTIMGMFKSVIGVALLFGANGISKAVRGESIV